MPIPTKANSPPGPSRRPVSIDAAQDRRNSLARPISSSALTAISPTTAASSRPAAREQFADVDVHADGEKENAEQKPLERLDSRLDRLAILGLGQQQARRQRRRAPSTVPPALATTPAATITNSTAAMNSSRDRVEATSRNSGRINSAAEHDNRGERDRGLHECAPRLVQHRTAGTRRHDRNEHQDRNDSEILRQQDGKLARPTLVVSRSWFDSSSITIAVEDNDRQAPRMSASEGLMAGMIGRGSEQRRRRPPPASRRVRKPAAAWSEDATATVRGRSGTAKRRCRVRQCRRRSWHRPP